MHDNFGFFCLRSHLNHNAAFKQQEINQKSLKSILVEYQGKQKLRV
ncbi:hypothetical protein QUB80_14630 [Chlorogloeopsis sp. ULAP01]|nr:hypothetical protein [Chlorogloeopsis sp. ULAP01]